MTELDHYASTDKLIEDIVNHPDTENFSVSIGPNSQNKWGEFYVVVTHWGLKLTGKLVYNGSDLRQAVRAAHFSIFEDPPRIAGSKPEGQRTIDACDV